MQNIVIYGAGGFGREVALMIRQINEKQAVWHVLGFFDDGKTKGEQIDGLPVLGGINEINDTTHHRNVVIGIADPAIRKKIVKQITASNITYPTIIHPAAMTGDNESNSFERGCIITAGCIMTTSVKLGEFVIVNLACTIGHDVTIGSYSAVMPGCNISGFVSIETEVYVGAGSIILPSLTIGANATIGAGAVVTKSIASHATAIGVPAKEFKTAEGLK